MIGQTEYRLPNENYRTNRLGSFDDTKDLRLSPFKGQSIPHLMEELEKNIAALQESIVQLDCRLTPVVRPAPQQAMDDSVYVEGDYSPFSKNMIRLNSMLARAVRDIRDLHDNLEI